MTTCSRELETKAVDFSWSVSDLHGKAMAFLVSRWYNVVVGRLARGHKWPVLIELSVWPEKCCRQQLMDGGLIHGRRDP